MEKRMMKALFVACLILSASTSPVHTVLNETFNNSTSNMTIAHNNRFVFLLPVLAPAISALASALGIAAAGTAAIGAGVALKEALDHRPHFGGSSGGYSGGSSSGSSSGSASSSSSITTYEELSSKATSAYSQVKQQVRLGTATLTALKAFDLCGLLKSCVGVKPTIFGPKFYVGVLVEKGKCPDFKVYFNGTAEELLTTTAAFQLPPSNLCNKECCMLKKNLLPGSICSEKGTFREGVCMPMCSSDKMALGDSFGCDFGDSCCGIRPNLVMG